MKELQIFNNEQFGEIRTIENDGKPYFCGKDVAVALGYSNTKDALSRHCRKSGVVKHDLGVQTGFKANGEPAMQKVQLTFIDEGNLYRLITHSKLPEAEKFESWVFDEVLPTIRKTGEYKVKGKPLTSLQKERESRLKAQLLYNLSKEVNIPEYKQVLQSYCTKELTGKHLLPLPEVEKPTYSAREAGAQLGITGNMFGRIAKKHGFKTEEYGKLFYDKSPYSAKEVETFRYYESAIEAVRKILEHEAA